MIDAGGRTGAGAGVDPKENMAVLFDGRSSSPAAAGAGVCEDGALVPNVNPTLGFGASTLDVLGVVEIVAVGAAPN